MKNQLIRCVDNKHKSEGELLRLHIRADSNGDVDQAVKLKVRDDIVAFLAEQNKDVTTFDEAYARISALLHALKQIADMRPNCDVLVVSCHWGEEGWHEPTDFQRETAQFLVDNGADLIIGTHPHVTQTAEWMTAADGHEAFVTYSLGNFISAQASPDNMIGTVLDVTFEKTTQPDGSVSVALREPRLWPVITQYDAYYSNIRVYPYADYTDELGAAHGNFALTRAYIEEVLKSSVDPQFLVLD